MCWECGVVVILGVELWCCWFVLFVVGGLCVVWLGWGVIGVSGGLVL